MYAFLLCRGDLAPELHRKVFSGVSWVVEVKSELTFTLLCRLNMLSINLLSPPCLHLSCLYGLTVLLGHARFLYVAKRQFRCEKPLVHPLVLHIFVVVANILW